MEIDNKFNCYSLTDEEFTKIINRYMPLIKKKSKKAGVMRDDGVQDIIISLHHTLTKNRKNKKL